jgi:hypothetical protein
MPKLPRKDTRLSTRSREEINYGIRQQDLSASAINELEEYKNFRLTGGKLAQKKLRQLHRQSQNERRISPELRKVQLSTFKQEETYILLFYGYLVKEWQYKLSELHLGLLLDLDRLEDYADWLVDDRGRTYCNGLILVNTAIAVAKFLNFDKTQRSDYLDVPVILNLKDLARKYSKQYQQNKKKTDQKKWRSKELTYPQLFEVVDYLLACCAPNRSKVSQSKQSPGKLIKGEERSLEAVVQAYQIHLIVKILVYAPWRQGEIRQWAKGKTLFREEGNGQPSYSVILDEHKLSQQNGELARKLPTALTPDLDDWINIWRPKIFNAIQTLEGWLEFSGYKLEDVEKLQQCLEAAKLGLSKRRVEDQQKYIEGLEDRLGQMQRRIAAWKPAKANLEANDTLFLSFGNSHPESFGKLLDRRSCHSLVTTAIAKATKYLFGETKSLNPHGFRHIAIKHCLEVQGNLEALAVYMNHSQKTQQEYLKQVFNAYTYTENFVDDWWKRKL